MGFFFGKQYFLSPDDGGDLISGCFFPHESPSHARTGGLWPQMCPPWGCSHAGGVAPTALLLLAAGQRGSLGARSQPCPVLSCLWPWGGCISKPPVLQEREGSPSSEALLECPEGTQLCVSLHPKGSAALQGSAHALPLAAAPALGAAQAQRGGNTVPRVCRLMPSSCSSPGGARCGQAGLLCQHLQSLVGG